MRLHLVVVLTLGSLLWSGCGLAVLTLAVHEHFHEHFHEQLHAEAPGGHHRAMQVALHGHAHEHAPDHEHDLTAPLNAVRSTASAPAPTLWVGGGSAAELTPAGSHSLAQVAAPNERHGAPPYLSHCALLT